MPPTASPLPWTIEHNGDDGDAIVSASDQYVVEGHPSDIAWIVAAANAHAALVSVLARLVEALPAMSDDTAGEEHSAYPDGQDGTEAVEVLCELWPEILAALTAAGAGA